MYIVSSLLERLNSTWQVELYSSIKSQAIFCHFKLDFMSSPTPNQLKVAPPNCSQTCAYSHRNPCLLNSTSCQLLLISSHFEHHGSVSVARAQYICIGHGPRSRFRGVRSEMKSTVYTLPFLGGVFKTRNTE